MDLLLIVGAVESPTPVAKDLQKALLHRGRKEKSLAAYEESLAHTSPDEALHN